MGFKIAELFVDITLRGAQFGSGLAAIKKGLDNIMPGLERLRTAALGVMAGIGAATGYAVTQYSRAADSVTMLKASLMATDQYSEQALSGLLEYAEQMQNTSVMSNTEMRNLMATAIKLGATVKDVKDVASLGAGLGELLFGGDAAEGMKRFVLAQQGQFRELSIMIPAIKQATNDYQRWQIVLAKAREGLALIEGRTQTVSGSITRLINEVSRAAQAFGALLVPYLQQAVDWAMKFTHWVESLSDAEKKWAVETAGVVAGIAVLVAALPTVINVASDFFNLLRGGLQILYGIATTLISIVTGPLGLVVVGLALAATAFGLFMTTGDTVVEHVANALGLLGDVANTFLGSWNSMCIGWETIVLTTTEGIEIALEYLRAYWTKWENFIGTGMDAFLTGLQDLWTLACDAIKNEMQNTANIVELIWTKVIDQISENVRRVGDEIALATGQITQTEHDRRVTDRQAADTDKENKIAIRGASQMYTGDRQVKNDAAKWLQDQINIVRASDATDNGTDVKRDQNIAAIKEQVSAEMAGLTNRLEKEPLLSDQIKSMIAELKKASGVEEFTKKLQELVNKIKGIKTAPSTFGSNGGPPTPGPPDFRGAASEFRFTSLQEAFKNRLATQLIGGQLQDQGKQEEKAFHDRLLSFQEQLLASSRNIESQLPAVSGMDQ